MSAAFRVSDQCPDCGAALQLRRNRTTSEVFVGCSGWPRCNFAEPVDHLHQRLARRVLELEAAMDAYAVARPTAPLEVIEKEITSLIYCFHPDRNPRPIDAHEVCVRLTSLRDAIRRAS